jgi:hypothetical protein
MPVQTPPMEQEIAARVFIGVFSVAISYADRTLGRPGGNVLLSIYMDAVCSAADRSRLRAPVPTIYKDRDWVPARLPPIYRMRCRPPLGPNPPPYLRRSL